MRNLPNQLAHRLPGLVGALIAALGLAVTAGGSAMAAEKPTPQIDITAAHTITQGSTLTVRVTVHPLVAGNGSGTISSTPSPAGSFPDTTTATTTSSTKPPATTTTATTTTPTTPTTPTTSTTTRATTTTSRTTTNTSVTSATVVTTSTPETTPTADTAVNGATGVEGPAGDDGPTAGDTTTGGAATGDTATSRSDPVEIPRDAPDGLRIAGAVFAAQVQDLGPATGQVTIYSGDESLGAGSLNDTGSAGIEADTGELHPGSFNLRVAYSGDDTFAPTSVTLSVTVVLVASTPTVRTSIGQLSSEQATTVAAPALASTGFDATQPVGYAFLFVGAGLLLLLAATRTVGRHRL